MSTMIHYANEQIGGGNPYWRCTSCHRTDPQISVEGHRATCEFVAIHEMRPSLEERFARLRAFIGEGYWLPGIVDFVRTLDTAKDLSAALDNALAVIGDAHTPEDQEAARELANEALHGVFI